MTGNGDRGRVKGGGVGGFFCGKTRGFWGFGGGKGGGFR